MTPLNHEDRLEDINDCLQCVADLLIQGVEVNKDLLSCLLDFLLTEQKKTLQALLMTDKKAV